MTAREANGAGTGGAWGPVAAITGWQTTASVCFYSVFAGTALFRAAFDVSRALTGLALTMVMVGYLLFVFPAGAVVDAFGEGSVMLAGLAGLAGAVLAVAAAPGYPWLLAAVFLLGAVYAPAMPATNRAILGGVPPERENLAMGIKQVGVTAGSAISAVIVTGLAARWGWRAGFLAIGALALAVLAAFGLTYEGSGGRGDLRLPAVGALAGDRAYRTLAAAGFFLGAAMFTTIGYVVVYATEHVGLPVAAGGVVLAVAQATGSVGRVVFGNAVDRSARPTGAAAARVLVAQAALAAALLLAVTRVDSLASTLAAFGALGVVLLGFTGVYYSCLSGLVPTERIGAATAGGQSALNLGALLAPPAFGFVVDRRGYVAGWLTLAACCLVGAALAAVVYRRAIRARGR